MKATLVWELSISNWLWEKTIVSQGLETPFRGIFSLPTPEDPASSVFKSIQLSLNVSSCVGFVFIRPLGNIQQWLTGSNVWSIIVSTLITCSSVDTIQPFSTICQSSRPFTSDVPMGFLLASQPQLQAEMWSLMLRDNSPPENTW